MCTKDLAEWSDQEETLLSLFSPTPEPSLEPDAFATFDPGQELSKISFLSRSVSVSSSEDEEFLQDLLQTSFPGSRGREMPQMSSTAGLPMIKFAPPSPRLLRERDREDHVCIEAVLCYRAKRGFRDQPVKAELQDKYRSAMCEGGELPCFCPRCLWMRNPVLKL
ncbi:unnamed protein product [Effrenium voratum]|nr:unnamed protein product [Effrenium voratum]